MGRICKQWKKYYLSWEIFQKQNNNNELESLESKFELPNINIVTSDMFIIIILLWVRVIDIDVGSVNNATYAKIF